MHGSTLCGLGATAPTNILILFANYLIFEVLPPLKIIDCPHQNSYHKKNYIHEFYKIKCTNVFEIKY